jgi:hypothetical protein
VVTVKLWMTPELPQLTFTLKVNSVATLLRWIAIELPLIIFPSQGHFRGNRETVDDPGIELPLLTATLKVNSEVTLLHRIATEQHLTSCPTEGDFGGNLVIVDNPEIGISFTFKVPL